ncbi:hypothetical protein RUM43_008553 [Polyplax serrata]|uniref:Uncharacterized protein n=1 Tax=Polyplax serrata TaxID=468196 RepID=A0AAN8NTT1_POLSC
MLNRVDVYKPVPSTSPTFHIELYLNYRRNHCSNRYDTRYNGKVQGLIVQTAHTNSDDDYDDDDDDDGDDDCETKWNRRTICRVPPLHVGFGCFGSVQRLLTVSHASLTLRESVKMIKALLVFSDFLSFLEENSTLDKF